MFFSGWIFPSSLLFFFSSHPPRNGCALQIYGETEQTTGPDNNLHKITALPLPWQREEMAPPSEKLLSHLDPPSGSVSFKRAINETLNEVREREWITWMAIFHISCPCLGKCGILGICKEKTFSLCTANARTNREHVNHGAALSVCRQPVPWKSCRSRVSEKGIGRVMQRALLQVNYAFIPLWPQGTVKHILLSLPIKPVVPVQAIPLGRRPRT